MARLCAATDTWAGLIWRPPGKALLGQEWTRKPKGLMEVAGAAVPCAKPGPLSRFRVCSRDQGESGAEPGEVTHFLHCLGRQVALPAT